jgi:hypothetical protein
MGNYHMDLHLSDQDILKLFKSRFGSELKPRLTLSRELTRRALRTAKVSDVTAIQTTTVETLVESPNVTRFVRRRV